MKLEKFIQSLMPDRIPSLFLNASLHALKKKQEQESGIFPFVREEEKIGSERRVKNIGLFVTRASMLQ